MGSRAYCTVEIARRSDAQEIKSVQKVTIHFQEAVELIDKIPIYVAKMLPWGFSLDNPVNTVESYILKRKLVDELRRLAARRERWNTDDLIEHMKKVGAATVNPVIVSRNKENRLGNPIFPPGYERYKDFLCEWAARCCFLSATARAEIRRFMEDMEKFKRKAWCKDVREVFFTSGDASSLMWTVDAAPG